MFVKAFEVEVLALLIGHQLVSDLLRAPVVAVFPRRGAVQGEHVEVEVQRQAALCRGLLTSSHASVYVHGTNVHSMSE